jgi:tetratricopeptide (TPR) repeat protein
VRLVALLLSTCVMSLLVPAARAQEESTAMSPVAHAAVPEHPKAVVRAAARGPRLDRPVRKALAIPNDWAGAPPVATLTDKKRTILEITPLQKRVTELAGASPAEAAEAHVRLANALASRGLEQAAAAEYLLALALGPESSVAYDNLGVLLRHAGALADAQEATERAIAISPNSGLAWFNLAIVLEARGHRKAAEEHYLRALELDPGLWLSSNNPGVVGNGLARRAVLARYIARGGPGGDRLDQLAPPAPQSTR